MFHYLLSFKNIWRVKRFKERRRKFNILQSIKAEIIEDLLNYCDKKYKDFFSITINREQELHKSKVLQCFFLFWNLSFIKIFHYLGVYHLKTDNLFILQ